MKKWFFCLVVLLGCGQVARNPSTTESDTPAKTKDTLAVSTEAPSAFFLAGHFDLFYTGSNRKKPVSISIDSNGNITKSKVYSKMWLDGEPPCQAVLYKRLDSTISDTFLLSTNMDFYYTLKMKHGKKSFDLVPKSVQP